jgi:hypothetical protein
MKTVILKPLSNKGKQRIHQHGDTWEIIHDRKDEFVLKSRFKTFSGGSYDIRRVSKENDPDFLVKESYDDCERNWP